MPGRHDERIRSEIESCLLVVSFRDRPKQLVTQAEIQGEARSGPNVILEVASVDLSEVIHIVEAHKIRAIGDAQQPRGDIRSAGWGPVGVTWQGRIVREIKSEEHTPPRIAWLKNRELFPADFHPKFRGVAAMNPCQVVGEHVAVLQLPGRLEGGSPDTGSNKAKAHGREPSDSRLVGNSFDAELAGYVSIRVRLNAVGVDPVIAEPKFVTQVRRKQVRFT